MKMYALSLVAIFLAGLLLSGCVVKRTHVEEELQPKQKLINPNLLTLFGMSVDDAVLQFGEIEEFEWWSGAIFRHKDSDLWFGYSNLSVEYEPTSYSIVTDILGIAANIFTSNAIPELVIEYAMRVDDESHGECILVFDVADLRVFVTLDCDGSFNNNSLVHVMVIPSN